MKKRKTANLLPDDIVIGKIHLVRNQKVMIDRDLAELYGVETKHLKQSVKRNLSRFPDDFMFELTENEFHSLRSQIVTSKNEGREGYVTCPWYLPSRE
jgi:hypothetical protein